MALRPPARRNPEREDTEVMQDRAGRRSRLFYVFYWLTVAAAVSMLLAFFRHGAPAGVKWGHVACFLGFLLLPMSRLG